MKEVDGHTHTQNHILYDLIICELFRIGKPRERKQIDGSPRRQQGVGKGCSVGTEFILGMMKDILELDIDHAT